MRPNIVMYFSDQQRADTCGCYGQKLDITPNLDQLAKEGIKFENADNNIAWIDWVNKGDCIKTLVLK